jgi:hypothetical protein
MIGLIDFLVASGLPVETGEQVSHRRRSVNATTQLRARRESSLQCQH